MEAMRACPVPLPCRVGFDASSTLANRITVNRKIEMNILLSIKPKWARLIYEGKKTIEWRKNIPNADFIDKVFLYETAPVRKVTGFFMYDHYFSLVLTGEDKPRDGADVLLDRGCVPLDELKKIRRPQERDFWLEILQSPQVRLSEIA